MAVTLHKDKKPISSAVTFVNGIGCSHSDCKAFAQYITKAFNAPVYYVYNPSNGVVKDIYNAVVQKMGFGQDSHAAQLLAGVWQHKLRHEKKDRIFHLAHSYGGIITELALKMMPEEERRQISVHMIGSPTKIDSNLCKSVKDFNSMQDPVGYLSFSKLTSRGYTHNVSSKSPTYKLDHSLLGETYRGVVDDLGNEYRRTEKTSYRS